jgi:glutathionylspermidine synthase
MNSSNSSNVSNVSNVSNASNGSNDSNDSNDSNVPFRPVPPLPADVVAAIRRRAIFECCKWDPQVEDVSTIADVPIVLDAREWCRLGAMAEALAHEVEAAEQELRSRSDLHGGLGLPRAIVKALGRASREPMSGARLIRFDFHHTAAGWRISEANTDVPGGLNEASGLSRIVAASLPGTRPAGDVAAVYAAAVTSLLPAKPHVALVHATAYSDDRQVMTYLARALQQDGARASLVSPAHLRWQHGRADLATEWMAGPLDAVVRFYPAEWMFNLPRDCSWPAYFGATVTPISNPATALLTQSKRFPLVWDRLRTPLSAWKALLPETRDPRDAPWQRGDDWVLKPALGRVGEDVSIAGVTAVNDWDRIARDVHRHPAHWVAQRRFVPTPLRVGESARYPNVGVYTVNGRVAGAYGRIAERPLIDSRARDAAVLIAEC